MNMLFMHNTKSVPIQRIVVFGLIAVVIVWRMILPVRGGQFGPDESMDVLSVQSILKGEGLSLIGPVGHFGIAYGPYSKYLLTLLYALTGFNLGLALLVSSIVLLAGPFLLAGYCQGEKYAIWVFLFALTSPLAIRWSMGGLWTIQFLIPLSALILYLGRPSCPKTMGREFAIGLLLGCSVGVHLQTIPFVAAILIWRVWVTKRIGSIISMGAGIFLAVMPYLIGLWQIRDQLSFSTNSAIYPGAANGILVFLFVLAGIFRDFGVPGDILIQSPGSLLHSIEVGLSQITVALTIVLIVLGLYQFGKSGWKNFRAEHYLAPFALCIVFYLPFGFITRTGLTSHNAMVFWWFAPLVIPIIIMNLLQKRAGIWCMSLLIGFNLMVGMIEYAPRFVNGTQASYAYGLGPSWWAYEEVASTLCAEVNNQTPKQDTVTVEISGDPWNERIRFILSNLIKLKYPDCAQRVRLIRSDTSIGRILRVEADPDGIHLRVLSVTR
jgi:hypothetical protein